MIQRPEYLNRIKPFIGKDIVKVLTGIRRAGKSILLKLIKSELIEQGVSSQNIKELNFEELGISTRPMMELHDELKQYCDKINEKCYLLLDEVQEVEGWERLINSLRVSTNSDIYITGSNSKLLSGELATHLAGRYVEFPIYPLSFSEIINSKEDQGDSPNREELFRQYIQWGGMPFIHANQLDSVSLSTYLRDVYQSVMLKDIVTRYSIRDVELLTRIFNYLFANIAQPFSGTSLIKYLRNEQRSISHETIYNYIRYAQEAGLVYLAPRMDVRGKQILSSQEKIYIADAGIREAVYGNNQRDIGQVLENIVYQELLRRGNNVWIGKVGEKEVDFLAEKQGQKHYYQVTYLLASPKVVEREFSAFEGIGDNFPKTILSLDKFNLSRDGILHQNIIDFLLEQL